MAIVSRRGTTTGAKVAWTGAYWFVSALPVLLFLGLLYNWFGERDTFEHWMHGRVTQVVKQIDKTPTPTPRRTAP